MNKLILSIAVAISLEGCSETNNIVWQTLKTESQPRELKISTCIFSFKSSTFKETFTSGSLMGVFVVPDQPGATKLSGCEYKNIRAQAIRQTDHSLRWECEPGILLGEYPIRVYAYYPYRPTASRDTASIPLRISADARLTPDFRFGTLTRGHKPINRHSPLAVLCMNPALAQLSFRLTLKNDSGVPHHLESIQVGNCPGSTRFCQRGQLNIADGTISGFPETPGATILSFRPAKILKVQAAEPFPIRVIPLSKPLQKPEIEVIFRIDERSYRYRFPVGTLWKSGYEYAYYFSFDGRRIYLDKMIQLFN